MKLNVIMKFVAKNPPSILILLGGLGWLLCGITNIGTFCSNWGWILVLGVIAQVIWLIYRYGKR